MRRRTRRGRMLSLGLLFIIYSAINVYSAGDVGDNGADSELDPNDPTQSSQRFSTNIPSNEDDLGIGSSTMESLLSSTITTATASSQPTTVIEEGPYRTYRKKRVNCTAPAIEQFPPTILPVWFRNHGGIILHILIAMFTFLGLAIVCDDYFVSSLDRLCEGIFTCTNNTICSPSSKLNILWHFVIVSKRIATIPGCGRCNVHGSRFFGTRIRNCHNRCIFCER